jgi:hypothetical protein
VPLGHFKEGSMTQLENIKPGEFFNYAGYKWQCVTSRDEDLGINTYPDYVLAVKQPEGHLYAMCGKTKVTRI